MKVCRVADMRRLEEAATSRFGITQEALMEQAGEAVYSVILRELGVRGKTFAIVCGTGNNGGDGFVVARLILSGGGRPRVFILGEPERFAGAARHNLTRIRDLPVETTLIKSIEPLESAIPDCDAVVDAVFGTGLDRPVTGLHREAIELINASRKTVFCVDIPSGVNGDTGQVMGTAAKGDFTITFGLPKIGNLLYPGFELCGRLYLSRISLPPELYDADWIKTQLNTPVKLPPRARDSHKGSFGRALFVAGSASYLGAPYFAAMSFLKAGGGLAYLATPRSVAPFIATKGSEIVFLPQKETGSGSLALANLEGLLAFAAGADFVVIGPGLSLDEETQALVWGLVRKIDRPVLIDGDGLTAIARDREAITGRRAETILTPHAGEMARLTGLSPEDVNRDRVSVLQQTTRELNSTIVLKGAHSLIGCPDGTAYVNTSGNPGMATAGSGDVLTGTIAALYSLGLPLAEAVRIGVLIHGLAGDLAAGEKGEDGITAQDILDYLPHAMKRYRQGFDEIAATLGGICRAV